MVPQPRPNTPGESPVSSFVDNLISKKMLRKSSSPSHSWLYSASAGRRPPTSPQGRFQSSLAHRPPSPAARPRRSSGTPSALARRNSQQLPGRSRSLDILLDSSAPSAAPAATEEAPCSKESEEQLLNECEQYLSAQELGTDQPDSGSDTQLNKTQSCHANLDTESVISSDSNSEAKQNGSQLSLPLPNAGEHKRKRNFMDRCVNKVRSLIRK
ncbi:uncharacterized protein [Anabrus simplex]|uniref:uncharacterized protein n=1 Tax=Anabrus simplex TaxID=316456 RepID=UPI0034DD2F72